jgi:hypothetical protein
MEVFRRGTVATKYGDAGVQKGHVFIDTRLLNDKPLSGSQQSPMIKTSRERTPLTRVF